MFIERIIRTEQISILEIVKYALSFWKLPLICITFFLLIDFILFLSPKEESFISESTIVSDNGSFQKMNLDSDLLDLIPQSFSNQSGKLDVGSFPAVFEYYPFLLNLLEETIYSEKLGEFVTLSDYLLAIHQPTSMDIIYGKINSIFSKFLSLFETKDSYLSSKDDEPKENVDEKLNEISPTQASLMVLLREHIRIENKMGSVVIETELPEPKTSTRLNNLVLSKLVEEVTRLRTARQNRNVNLIKIQLDSVRKIYNKSQLRLAEFLDGNKGNNSAYVNSKLQSLNSEFSLQSGIYSKVYGEYESAKIELIQNSPFFEVIQPAYVPFVFKESKIISLRKSILFGTAFGFLIAVGYTALLIFINIKERLKEINI